MFDSTSGLSGVPMALNDVLVDYPLLVPFLVEKFSTLLSKGLHAGVHVVIVLSLLNQLGFLNQLCLLLGGR
jgi:hypothetical protein